MKNCVFKASVSTKKWFKAAGVRAVKTAAQTAVGVIGAAAVMGAVDWQMAKTAVLAAQEHYGIKLDGAVGAETRKVLRWN